MMDLHMTNRPEPHALIPGIHWSESPLTHSRCVVLNLGIQGKYAMNVPVSMYVNELVLYAEDIATRQIGYRGVLHPLVN